MTQDTQTPTQTDEAPAAEAKVPRFPLGPQPDGSIIARIPDDSHLVTLLRAIEKQKKNAIAARGTIAALKDRPDPLLDEIERELDGLYKAFARSRAPANQVADTPIGRALYQGDATASRALDAALDAVNDGVVDELESIDGRDDMRWLASVPTPRPKLGQLVRPPTGKPSAILSIDGYDANLGVFLVNVAAIPTTLGVLPHWNLGTGEMEWRMATSASETLAYATPRIGPDSPEWARRAKPSRAMTSKVAETNAKPDAPLTTKQKEQRSKNAKAAGIRPNTKGKK